MELYVTLLIIDGTYRINFKIKQGSVPRIPSGVIMQTVQIKQNLVENQLFSLRQNETKPSGKLNLLVSLPQNTEPNTTLEMVTSTVTAYCLIPNIVGATYI